MEAPPEELAYVAMIDPTQTRPDAMGVVDLKPGSATFGRLIARWTCPRRATSCTTSAGTPAARTSAGTSRNPHVERRYLVVPGIHSSRIHILDTKPDPARPKIVKVIEGSTLAERTGYAAPHTVHCGTDAIYMNALGAPDGGGPGGIFRLDHDTFEVLGPWEADRGPQQLAYDFWWHLGHDTMITSEWGTPNMVTEGLNPELLLAGKYGHQLHVFDLNTRKHRQTIDLGKQYQMVLELRPAHDPRKAYGFAGVVISLEDLSASIWTWYLEGGNGKKGGEWKAKKIIDIPAVPADPGAAAAAAQGIRGGAAAGDDINLSLDDRYLYVSCWGTGELLQYDVSDPFAPVFKGKVAIGGIAARTAHPGSPGEAAQRRTADGGSEPRRAPGVLHQLAVLAVGRAVLSRRHRGLDGEGRREAGGGLALDPGFLVEFEQGMRPAPGAAAGRRHVLRLVLLFVMRRRLAPGPSLADAAAARRAARTQPGHGLALRGGARVPGAPGARGVARPAATRRGPRARRRRGAASAGDRRPGLSRGHGAGRARRDADRTRCLPPALASPSAHGGNAGQCAATHGVVIPDGVGARGGADGAATHDRRDGGGDRMRTTGCSMPRCCQARRWRGSPPGFILPATCSMTGLIAWLVYEKLGLRRLTSVWFNVDFAWAVALIITGGVVLVQAT